MTRSSVTRPRVGVVALVYNPRYIARTLAVLDRVVDDLDATDSVLVVNSDAAEAWLRGAGVRTATLRHDNRGLEFGGYQAGVRHLLTRQNLDWVFVANDTVGNTDPYTTPYHRRFSGTLDGYREAPTIVGRVNSISRSYQIDGCRTHRWIRTNVFALNRPALEMLDHRLYDVAVDGLVHAEPDPKRFFDASLDPVLKEHVGGFLFDTGEPWHWYDARPLDGTNAVRMAAKARSILQEKQLSARLDQGSADFVDIMDMGRQDRLRHKFDTWRFEWRAGAR